MRVNIENERVLLLEMQGKPDDYYEYTQNFIAGAYPEADYRFEWDFDDGSAKFSETRNPGEKSGISHTFTNLQEGDVFNPVVRLYDLEGKLLASDSVTIRVTINTEDETAGPRYLDCGWEVNYDELTWVPNVHHPGNGYFINDAGQLHGPNVVSDSDGRLVVYHCYFEGEMHGYSKRWSEFHDYGYIQIQQSRHSHGQSDGLQLWQSRRWDWDAGRNILACRWRQDENGVYVEFGQYDGLCQWY